MEVKITMADFDQAVAVVLANEGGLSDHPKDPGGITKYGIILDVLRREGPNGDIDGDGDIDADDIRLLTIDDAKQIYCRQWWEAYGYGRIIYQGVATKIFDMAVNTGPRQGHLMTQRALRANGFLLKEDGILGPKTMDAINRAYPERLIPTLRSESAGFYRLIATKKPEFKAFILGWLRRAYQ
jgi:lysozyme family protein